MTEIAFGVDGMFHYETLCEMRDTFLSQKLAKTSIIISPSKFRLGKFVDSANLLGLHHYLTS